jgi:GTP-binding protein Era
MRATGRSDPAPAAAPSSGPHRAGTVALVGRPNAGKSTLLNALVGVKLSIVTARPETTRNRVAGVKSLPGAQFVFLDTPGIHDPRRGVLSRRLVEIARAAMQDADAIAVIVDSAAGVGGNERSIVEAIRSAGVPALVALNKMDAVARSRLLPLMDTLGRLLPGREIVPVSGLTGENLPELEGCLRALLPVGPPLYPGDDLTDQPERFLAQEMVREKIFQLTHAEVPYASAVVTEEFTERSAPRGGGRASLYIRATVITSRPSQRAIIVGRGGAHLKTIGTRARHDLERFFGRRVYLDLHVKVEKGWETNPTVLREVGL